MANVVLVVLQEEERAPTLLDAGARLLNLAGGGRLIGLAIRTAMDAINSFAEGVLTEEAADLLAESDRTRVGGIRTAYADWTARKGSHVSAEFVESDGPTESAVEERGSRADFIVIDRPHGEDDRPARGAFRAALFESERPVLVVPPAPPTEFGRRIAIAWRDDKRTTKAVMAAFRCLGHAESVLVLAGLRDFDAQRGLPPVLVEHGVEASLRRLPIGEGELGDRLLREIGERSADMLVMGAYVHNPIRRFMLGGVTRIMLARAEIPVLMRY